MKRNFTIENIYPGLCSGVIGLGMYYVYNNASSKLFYGILVAVLGIYGLIVSIYKHMIKKLEEIDNLKSIDRASED